jgi:excisionase family DNA binding protein
MEARTNSRRTEKAAGSRSPRFEDLDDLLTVREACTYLRISRNVVYSLVASGELDSRRFGRSIRILKSSFQPMAECASEGAARASTASREAASARRT